MKNTKINLGSFALVKLQTKWRSLLAVIALVAIIGFSMAACAVEEDNPFIGTWSGSGLRLVITDTTWSNGSMTGTYTHSGNSANFTQSNGVSYGTATVSGDTMTVINSANHLTFTLTKVIGGGGGSSGGDTYTPITQIPTNYLNTTWAMGNDILKVTFGSNATQFDFYQSGYGTSTMSGFTSCAKEDIKEGYDSGLKVSGTDYVLCFKNDGSKLYYANYSGWVKK